MIAVPLAEDHITTLVIPGLWEWLWRKRIDEFENDPRLCPSITGATAAQTEATRRRWLAAKQQTQVEGNLPTDRIALPHDCFDTGRPFTFPRWMLGRGKDWADDWIASHPLVADRSIRWLRVDAGDKVTASQEGP